MGLNNRKSQIVMGLLPILSCSLLVFWPFVWRALKTKRGLDRQLAVGFSVLELIGLVCVGLTGASDDSTPDTLVGMLLWIIILSATATAAWLYRPLNKEERMDEQSDNARPGSTYLN